MGKYIFLIDSIPLPRINFLPSINALAPIDHRGNSQNPLLPSNSILHDLEEAIDIANITPNIE